MVFFRKIFKRQQISVKYLDNIITALKTEGLITNKKGKKSGYKLTRKPSEINIWILIMPSNQELILLTVFQTTIHAISQYLRSQEFLEGI